ncbi:MAG: hybrid sensor histidine kinase/response regulator [Anaerolineae bacterium]|nr:hybrid sensor histidine kinase/response regulator [Anaerolineae bacterium]
MVRIHIIDDDELTRKAVSDMLKTAGYQVTESSRSPDGLKWVKQNLPDVVLCDVMMPEISGFDVLRELRSDPTTVDIPFIYLTDQGDRELRRAGMNLGANDFMTKQFAQNDLLLSIESRLGQRARELAKHETTITQLRKNIIYALPHELRTPLTHILGNSKFMMSYGQTLTPDDYSEMAESIFHAGERLNRLFENYLAVAQLALIEANADDVKRLRNNVLDDAAEVIVEVATVTARQYGREDDLVLILSSSSIRMSRENFAKVVGELVDNAFKFSPPGTRVYVKGVRRDDRYVVFIRDHGRGMTREQVSSIGAYMQFERALHEQQGLGLGFCLAKRIVNLHNGDFVVRSEPEKGARILFSVPD